MWGKGNTPLLVGVQTGTAALEIRIVISSKTGKQSTSKVSNATFGYKLKECSILPQEELLNYVYSSIILS